MIDTDAKKLIRCLAELPVLRAAVAAGDGFPGCQQLLATFLEIDSKPLGIHWQNNSWVQENSGE